MQVQNPLIPPAPGQAGGAPSPVANAPRTPERETARPVEAPERAARSEPESRDRQRGGNVDITA